MSDQSPPPKPKPGSLRDRIAAFEKSSASAAPAPPPPRPKPGGVSWKPKPPSPPSSPKSNPDGEKKAGGMSASDAKESIGKGVSLKERMAALQGKGGFGAPAPAPPTAPKPGVERPKWKPPPVVSPPAEEGSDPIVSEPTVTADVTIEAQKSLPIVSEDASTPPAPPTDEDEKDKEAVDPDEEERQRRAAITARIARLGGARVGMGPPIFGRPAVPAKKPSLPHEEPAEQKESKDEELTVKTLDGITDEPVQEHAIDPSKERHSVVSEEGSSSEGLQPPEEVSPPRVPSSMPVPAVPRRAAPPRRKAKSPAPPLEEASPTPLTTEDESQAAISDDVTPAAAPAPLSEPAADPEEHGLKLPSSPPMDAHVEPVTSEMGPVDLPKAMPGADDKEDGTPAAVDMDKTTSSIADRDSDEADPPKATLASAETESEEPVASTPAPEKSDSPNSPEEPSFSFAKESTQPEVKAESPLQQSNLEVHDEDEERAERRTVDADDKTPSPISQRASVAIDTPSPTVDLAATFPPSDAVASPATASREEESPEPVVEPAEEEEEAARKARVAARLAKMGAVNPFAPLLREDCLTTLFLLHLRVGRQSPPMRASQSRLLYRARRLSYRNVTKM
ncbi:assembly of actin patch protein [Pleurotus ostreatus]|nr:assembly of actin patch protein [Pleurotus ostreatus]